MNSCLEQWRPIPKWEGLYQVSDHGRVRSLPRVRKDRAGKVRRWPGKQLALVRDGNGYLRVNLSDLGRREARCVHGLVAEAFIGSRPESMEVCHNDGNRDNNALSNLRYGTALENQRDRRAHGTDPTGSRNGRSKLTDLDVERIRTLSGKRPIRNLASEFGVSESQIRRVQRGEFWRHVI